MQLFVQGQNLHTVIVDGSETVLDLKTYIANAEGIPTEEQILFYGGRPLEDGLNLVEYELADLATVEVALRLLGGMSFENTTNSFKFKVF